MDLFNSALGRNITFTRPAYFIISGFTGIPYMQYYYVFLCFVYIASVFGNTLVMVLIYLDHNLRTPKYVAVFNLALVDLLSSTSQVPKVLDIFLFNHFTIPYLDCLMFFFFSYFFLSLQSLNLVALSYDRVVAIMYPLHYQTKVTNRFMLSLIACFWVFVTIAVLTAVGLLTRLSFCNSVVINSYFCDHGQIYRLACNDAFPSFAISYVLPFLLLWLPFAIILFSYLCIGYSLAKVALSQERRKALKTCSAHISLVIMYFIPILMTFTIGAQVHPNARILNLSLASVLPPMLNPIIYVLQTQEIKSSMKKIFKIIWHSRITVK
ncbi:olfactory receptor 1E16-like [Nothobranchius furzeri]|uniref:Olfactory receptor 1-like n=1 Tax=Nothobranchius furzeri TaxID=105023 RepID=A0A8C6MLG1_NOTFU|nr:olfactory receptor 1-like [Nothobranchius furzeri]KAF7199320.1 olfactory receptor 1-like [Nothobranchius furzeri]